MRFSRLAVALKSGHETLLTRVPMQLLTTLSLIPNLVIVGDTQGWIAGREMVDVYSGVYERVRERVGVGRTVVENVGRVQKRVVGGEKGVNRVVSGQEVKSNGWVTDAHKNLPGFQLLVDTFADIEIDWYIMIDDDSYVFWDNLELYLSTHDPSVPYFTGRNNYFKGCDGVTNFKDGPYIAQGGSGIVISRGAMLLMREGLDECILKYETCWAGDIRTALCLRDVGVKVTWGDGFYQHPPGEEVVFPEEGCERVNVFHHVLPEQVLQSSPN
ncbi:hypothetical protein HDU98_004310 [Podochytrium sp. JEL0797]|nr:hypothetical protein HDU98_004310 [Podochytrium sp. JEL0797]